MIEEKRPVNKVPITKGFRRGPSSVITFVRVRAFQSIEGKTLFIPRSLAPTQVLKVYIGIIVHGFVIYTPTIVTNLFNRKRYAQIIPSTVWMPRKGDIPIKTPIAKDMDSLTGDSLTLDMSLSFSLNANADNLLIEGVSRGHSHQQDTFLP